MKTKLLLLLTGQGYSPEKADEIVAILMQDPVLSVVLKGEVPESIFQGPYLQHCEEGILYFAPSR